jgi:nuclear pore complex protein Nup54
VGYRFGLQLQGASAELPRRVEALLSISRMQVGVGGGSQSVLLGPGKIDNQSLAEMHEVGFFSLTCICVHIF